MAEATTQIARARVSFVAATTGEWLIERVSAVRGEPLGLADALTRLEGPHFSTPPDAAWTLRGVRSHERYLRRDEKHRLASIQEGLGRATSSRAALIPIAKSAAWWDLAQDERRAILEERSAHIALGSRYLPAIARRLYHGRDLGEPFDFLTWFEFAEADAGAFDELVGRLRETEEWRYVLREVEVRVRRGATPGPLAA